MTYSPRELATTIVSGKYVWFGADAETVAQAYLDAEKVLRVEFFRQLPDLDWETERDTWAWQEHPWFALLALTDEECTAALKDAA